MRTPILLLCCLPVLFGALILSSYLTQKPDRDAINARIVTLRNAVKKNDTDAMAQLVAPAMRDDFRSGKLRSNVFLLHFFNGPQKPKVNLRGTDAWITPTPERHFWILPGGSSVAMKKIDGAWYFTDRVSID